MLNTVHTIFCISKFYTCTSPISKHVYTVLIIFTCVYMDIYTPVNNNQPPLKSSKNTIPGVSSRPAMSGTPVYVVVGKRSQELPWNPEMHQDDDCLKRSDTRCLEDHPRTCEKLLTMVSPLTGVVPLPNHLFENIRLPKFEQLPPRKWIVGRLQPP